MLHEEECSVGYRLQLTLSFLVLHGELAFLHPHPPSNTHTAASKMQLSLARGKSVAPGESGRGIQTPSAALEQLRGMLPSALETETLLSSRVFHRKSLLAADSVIRICTNPHCPLLRANLKLPLLQKN